MPHGEKPLRPVRTAWPARTEGRTLHIGLVNNMSDGALAATDRQFTALLTGRGRPVRLHRFHLPETPRSAAALDYLKGGYRDVAGLYETTLDGLVVTGSEPREDDIRAEAYWPALRRIADWAQTHTRLTIWSCLAAHAAVLHLHGVERRRLDRKLSGVFTRTQAAAEARAFGLAAGSSVPHSRQNTVDADRLEACGFEVLTRIEGGDPDVFLRRGETLQLFIQGHPEYEADTLALEFERDLRRHLGGRAPAPDLPRNAYPAAVESLVRRRIRDAKTDPADEVLADVRRLILPAPAPSWKASALALYGACLAIMDGGDAADRRPSRIRPETRLRA